MNTTLKRLLAACLTLLLTSPGLAATKAQRELNFEVLLDGDRIGTHAFRITDGSDARIVESSASFDVSILFVNVFRYRHSNTEIWHDGCVKRINSETDANGTPYQVNLRRSGDLYRVITLDDTATYPVDCVMTFAYWDPAFLKQPRLLNAQTGELVEVRVQQLGTDRPGWLPTDAGVQGYRIVAEAQGVDIRVFYDQIDGRWLGLESLLENGRVMRYVPTDSPQDTVALAVPDVGG